MLKDRLEQDLKAALLGGDKAKADTLRSLKNAILYEEVAKGLRDKGLDESSTINLLSKEAKKRQESADLYRQGGNEERAQKELNEKTLIETYLPESLSDDKLNQLIDKAMVGIVNPGPQNMGQIIATVKNEAAGAADGATIAKLVKERLTA